MNQYAYTLFVNGVLEYFSCYGSLFIKNCNKNYFFFLRILNTHSYIFTGILKNNKTVESCQKLNSIQFNSIEMVR